MKHKVSRASAFSLPLSILKSVARGPVLTLRLPPPAARADSEVDATQGPAQAAAADVAARLVPARRLPAARPRPRVRRLGRRLGPWTPRRRRGAECRLRAHTCAAPGGRRVAGGGSSQRCRRPLRRRGLPYAAFRTEAGPSPEPNGAHLPAAASGPGPASRLVDQQRLCPRARSVDLPGVGQSPGPPRAVRAPPWAAAAEAPAVRGGLPRARGVQRRDGRVCLPCWIQRQRVWHAQPAPVQRRQERRAVARQPLCGRVR